jgi:hypothetical protein
MRGEAGGLGPKMGDQSAPLGPDRLDAAVESISGYTKQTIYESRADPESRNTSDFRGFRTTETEATGLPQRPSDVRCRLCDAC